MGKYDIGYWSGPYIFWYKRVTMDTKFDYAKMVQEHLDVPSDLDQYQTLIQEVYNLPTL